MNVKELIEKLNHFDPELMVIVRGYESGEDEASNVGKVHVKLNANTEWYYGQHEVPYSDSDPFDCEAIYIH
jgi:hypothetical protein